MKKLFILAAILLTPLFASCANQDNVAETITYSELRGTYVHEDSDVEKVYKKTFEDNSSYLFAATYPFFLLEDNTVFYYSSSQKLSLKKDFTYRYEYSIALSNSAYQEICRIDVDMSGTFEYETLDKDLEKYYVLLSNPTSGKQEIYSPIVRVASSANYWSEQTSPSYSINIKEVSTNPYFSYDKYISARKVVVNKSISDTDYNKVEDGLFNNFLIDDLCKYCIEAPTR